LVQRGLHHNIFNTLLLLVVVVVVLLVVAVVLVVIVRQCLVKVLAVVHRQKPHLRLWYQLLPTR
jgi:hypothetical protein